MASAEDNCPGLNGAMRWLVQGQLSHAVAEAALQARRAPARDPAHEPFGRSTASRMQVVSSTVAFKLRAIDLSFLPRRRARSAPKRSPGSRRPSLSIAESAPLLRGSLLRLESAEAFCCSPSMR